MIQPTCRRRGRSVLVVLLLLAMGPGAGCGLRPAEAEAQSTPAAPVWRPEEVGQTLRALGSAGSVLQRSGSSPSAAQRAGRVADYLASQLHAHRVQPAAEAYRLHYASPLAGGTPGAPAYLPLVAGIVSGRDPAAADEVVIVYAALDPDAADPSVPAAWLELSRIYAELVRFYRFPVRSILFLMPVGADHEAVLEAYGRQPVWPMAQVRAVLSLGDGSPGAEAWRRIGVLDGVEVTVLPGPAAAGDAASPVVRSIEMARRGYAWLLPHLGAPAIGGLP